MGFLTTHVLDTANGKPANGLRLELFQISDGRQNLVTEQTTNMDGRCDQHIAADDVFISGTYQLEFHVGEYFQGKGMNLEDPAFLNVIPIRFGIASPNEHYHVPLLVSPYSYSTYRGS